MTTNVAELSYIDNNGALWVVCVQQLHAAGGEPAHVRHPLLRGQGQERHPLVARPQLQGHLALRLRRQARPTPGEYSTRASRGGECLRVEIAPSGAAHNHIKLIV